MSGEEGPWSVQLYVYDLSQGMAKQFSPAFLGHEIEGIWHTGIVVYGKEYFYGGGIQAGRPGGTQAGRPMRIHDLGVTYIPESVFVDFLQEISHRFTPETYSLLKHNCNNFSDEAAMFLVGDHIPSYITGLPEFAFSTPMGQMLKPMFEQFENQMKSQMGSVPIVPWSEPSGAIAAPAADANPTPAVSISAAKVDEAKIESKDGGAAKPKPMEGEVLSVSFANDKDVKEEKGNWVSGKAPAANPSQAQAASFLASLAASAIASGAVSSSAPSTAPAAVDLAPIIADVSVLKVVSPASKPFLSLDNQKHPKVYLEALSSKSVPAGVCDKKSVDSLQSVVEYLASSSPSAPLPLGGLQTLNNAIKSWPTAHLFSVLSLLRLAAGKPAVAQYYLSNQKQIILTMLGRCISGLSSSDSNSKTCSMSAKLMAMCALANFLGHGEASRKLVAEADVIEAALICLGDKQKFMRVTGANVAFNCSLLLRQQSDSDFVIQLVSKVAHVTTEESDDEVYQRLLLALGHLILYNSEAASLLQALEIQFKNDSEKAKTVISDITFIMSNAEN
jgi:hypothetical protein